MTGLENAQHDLIDAQFSLQAAIELLGSIEQDDPTLPGELHTVLDHLRNIKSELDLSFGQLQELQRHEMGH